MPADLLALYATEPHEFRYTVDVTDAAAHLTVMGPALMVLIANRCRSPP